MDIEILLWLQALREMLGPLTEELFVIISAIGAGAFSLLLPCVFFWVIDRKTGLIILVNFAAGNLVNALIKMTACVYRPWVRDSRIRPAARALPHARGYSFPSGHSQASASEWLSAGWIFRNRRKWILPLSVVSVWLVMFSRCYLGCHTPQDVIAGFLISIPLLFAGFWVVDAAEKGKLKQILTAAVIIAVLAAVYFECKEYPMDYVNGVLAVDPEIMKENAFEAVGYFLGIFSGWYMEETYVHSSCECAEKQKWIRCLIGAAECILAYLVIPLASGLILPYKWNGLFRGFLTFFTAVFLTPLTYTKLEEKTNGKSSD